MCAHTKLKYKDHGLGNLKIFFRMFLKISPANRIKLVLGWLFKTGKVETDLSFILEIGFLACCMRGARPAPLFQDLG